VWKILHRFILILVRTKKQKKVEGWKMDGDETINMSRTREIGVNH
jgi:hypothetical protein